MIQALHAEHERRSIIMLKDVFQNAFATAGPDAMSRFGSRSPRFSPARSSTQVCDSQEGLRQETDAKYRCAGHQSQSSSSFIDLGDVHKSSVNSHLTYEQVKEGMTAFEGASRNRQCLPVRQTVWETIEHATLDHRYDAYVGILIVVNMIVIGWETDAEARNPRQGQSHLFLRVASAVFTIMFVLEMAVKVRVKKWSFFLGPDKRWNIFDLVIVCVCAIEELIHAILSYAFPVFDVMRVLRLVRLLRVVRVLRFMSDLRSMVWGITNSMTSLMWALLLLCTVMFSFAVVVMHNVTRTLHQEGAPSLQEQDIIYLRKNFGSLSSAIYVLFKSFCGGEDWGTVAGPLISISPVLGFGFCLYIAFQVFAVLNVVTAIFVERAIQAATHDVELMIMRETETRNSLLENARNVFMNADVDGSGQLDHREFSRHLDDPFVQAYFRQLDLNIERTGASNFFQLLDFDNNGSIDVDEFLLGCSKLKGFATSLDLERVNHMVRRQDKCLSQVAADLSKLKDNINIIFGLEQISAQPPATPSFQRAAAVEVARSKAGCPISGQNVLRDDAALIRNMCSDLPHPPAMSLRGASGVVVLHTTEYNDCGGVPGQVS